MTWRLPQILQCPRKKARDEEVQELRGLLAQAAVTNDRRVDELQKLLAGTLKLREDYGK